MTQVETPTQTPASIDKPSTGRQIAAAIGFLGAVAVVAVLGALANMGQISGWYAEVEKVAWNPPNQVFGPAWTILYLLIAIAGFVLWRQGFAGRWKENGARALLILFVAQLALNALWSPAFFATYPLIGEAGWWIALIIIVILDVLVAWLIIACWHDYRIVSILLVPYLCWILFATTLNAGIIFLN